MGGGGGRGREGGVVWSNKPVKIAECTMYENVQQLNKASGQLPVVVPVPPPVVLRLKIPHEPWHFINVATSIKYQGCRPYCNQK